MSLLKCHTHNAASNIAQTRSFSLDNAADCITRELPTDANEVLADVTVMPDTSLNDINELEEDGAPASDSEDNALENYTTDPIPQEESLKKTSTKRGRPRKGQYLKQTKASSKKSYNTRSRLSVSEATTTATATSKVNFRVDD